MRDFEDLSDVEKMLRTLVFCIDSKDDCWQGEAFMYYKLEEAKELMEKLGIPQDVKKKVPSDRPMDSKGRYCPKCSCDTLVHEDDKSCIACRGRTYIDRDVYSQEIV